MKHRIRNETDKQPAKLAPQTCLSFSCAVSLLTLCPSFRFLPSKTKNPKGRKSDGVEQRTMAEEEVVEWDAFAGILECDTFANVFDFLYLEDVARLMMCSRSLREMGKENKDWKRAVALLSKQNVYGQWDGTLNDDIDDFYANGAVPDPRIKPGFASKPYHEQFGLLFVFQRDCVTNLLSCFDIENLAICDCGREYSYFTYNRWPPGMWRDMWEMHQGYFDSSPPRIVMIDRIAQLYLAQCELQAIYSPEVPAYWLRGTFMYNCVPEWGNTSSDEAISSCLEAVYDVAQRSGDRFCSDANFKQFIDDCYDKSRVEGLGEQCQDSISIMGKLRSNFDRIAKRLGPLLNSRYVFS